MKRSVEGEIASCGGIAEEFERGVGDGMIREVGTTAMQQRVSNRRLAGVFLVRGG